MKYSILIPIYNEERLLPELLSELKPFSTSNELLIINDGSTDSSFNILSNCSYITLINLEINHGKGYALKRAIKLAKFDKILIFDGDLELKTSEIDRLMILNSNKGIMCAFGSRFKNINALNSFWDFGN